MSLYEVELNLYTTGDSIRNMTRDSRNLFCSMIVSHMTIEDLSQVCVNMGISIENIKDREVMSSYAREFLGYCQRRFKMQALVDTLNDMSEFPFSSFDFFKVVAHTNLTQERADFMSKNEAKRIVQVLEGGAKKKEEKPELAWSGQVESLWGNMVRRLTLDDMNTLVSAMGDDPEDFSGPKARRAGEIINYYVEVESVSEGTMVRLMEQCLVINEAFFETE